MFLGGKSVSRFIDQAKVNQRLLPELAEWAPIAKTAAGRISRSGGPWRLLVPADDWCGNMLNSLTVISPLADAYENVAVPIVSRDEC